MVRGEGHMGVLLLFGAMWRGGDVPNSKNRPKRACFCYSALCEEGTCPTAKTSPKGRVFGVRHDVEGKRRAEQHKHTIVGVFVMFGT